MYGSIPRNAWPTVSRDITAERQAEAREARQAELEAAKALVSRIEADLIGQVKEAAPAGMRFVRDIGNRIDLVGFLDISAGSIDPSAESIGDSETAERFGKGGLETAKAIPSGLGVGIERQDQKHLFAPALFLSFRRGLGRGRRQAICIIVGFGGLVGRDSFAQCGGLARTGI